MLNKELLRLKILEAYALGYIEPKDDYDRRDSWGFNFEDGISPEDYPIFIELGREEFFDWPHCKESDEVHIEVSREILSSPLMKALR